MVQIQVADERLGPDELQLSIYIPGDTYHCSCQSQHHVFSLAIHYTGVNNFPTVFFSMSVNGKKIWAYFVNNDQRNCTKKGKNSLWPKYRISLVQKQECQGSNNNDSSIIKFLTDVFNISVANLKFLLQIRIFVDCKHPATFQPINFSAEVDRLQVCMKCLYDSIIYKF